MSPKSSSHRLRLIYFAPSDIQTARVVRKNIMKFCEAMANRDVDVTLVSMSVKVMRTEPTATRTIWDVFGVHREFRTIGVRLPMRQRRLDSRWGKIVLRVVRAVSYPAIALYLVLRNTGRPEVTVLYTRNYGLVPGLRLATCLRPRGARVILESHIPPRNGFQRWALRKAAGAVCNGPAVHRALLDLGYPGPDRLIAIHQGFSPEAYPSDDSKNARQEARRRLAGIESDKLVVYTGKVFWPYAEIRLLLQAASLLRHDGIHVAIVGGRADHVERWRNEALARNVDNISFVGFIAPSEVADWHIAADVLVSYYPSGIELNEYRSPGKLFEYMASGTPIVAANYASLREVLHHGRNAFLVEPDDPSCLAESIRKLVGDRDLSEQLGARARKDAMQYTWAARAETICAFATRLGRP